MENSTSMFRSIDEESPDHDRLDDTPPAALRSEGRQESPPSSTRSSSASDQSPYQELTPGRTDVERQAAVTNGDDAECLRCGPRRSLAYVASLLAAVGGLLFGYDTGVISGALLQLKHDFSLTCHQSEIVVSSLLIGALFAALAAGFVVDRFGRRKAVIVNSVIFMIGTIILAVSQNFPMLIVGRLLIGFGVSFSAISECIYIAEISPVNKRGFLVSLNEFSIAVGFLLAYLLNYLLINMPSGWRWMFAVGVLPAMGQCIGMIFMPPSPRYLMLSGDQYKVKARLVLRRLRPDENVELELKSIEESLKQDRAVGFRQLCGIKNNMLPRLAVGILLVFFQQTTGQPNVLFYVPSIFKMVGVVSSSSAVLASVALGVVKVLATGVALYNLDKFGRRKGLMGGTTIMMVSILILGIIAKVYESDFPTENHCVTHVKTTHPPHDWSDKTWQQQFIFNNQYKHSDMTIHQGPLKQSFFLRDGPAVNKRSVELPSDLADLQTGDDRRTTGLEPIPTTDAATTEPAVVSVSPPVENHTKTNGSDLYEQPFEMSGLGVPYNHSETLPPPPGSDIPTIPRAWAYVTLVCLMFYVAGFAVGFGPGTWLVLSEIFPISIRGRALSVAVTFNWMFNLVLTLTFLDSMGAIGVSATFLVYAGVCLLSIFFIFFFVPETKGRSLEEITEQLQNWSIRQKLKDVLCVKSPASESEYEQLDLELSSSSFPISSDD